MSELFEKRDLAEATFRNVSLHGAVFEDVNLSEVSIRNANLMNLTIDDAYIAGLTISGFRVDRLIEAELDRRDPERLKLRMTDRYDPREVGRVMGRLDQVREGFYQLLRQAGDELLTNRPGKDQWSVIEILRHLIFSEELYLNRWILANDEPWSKVGLLSDFLAGNPDYVEVGSEPAEDLETVLAAWIKIHDRMQSYLAGVTAEELRRDTSEVDFGQGSVGNILQLLADHDLGHIRQAEGVLAGLE